MALAIRFSEVGGPGVLRIEQGEPDEPAPGEALIRHTAIGLNFIDTYHRSGMYPVELPSGLGVEAAGVVERVGEGVTLRPGERVAYAGGPPGAYAEYRTMAAERLVAVPEGVSDRDAAAVLLKGMTVEYLIHRTYRPRRGDIVLWHAAAGGVGLIACQWLRSLGVTVIGTVGSDEKAELAREHGCAHPIVYTRDDFVERVRELTDGRGVRVVYDSVGRATFDGSLDCLERRGMMVSFGNASGAPDPIEPGLLARKGSLFLTRPTLFDYTSTRKDLVASAEAVFDVVRRGEVAARVDRVWPLEQAADAHRALEQRRTTGSSLLVPEPG